MKHRKSVSIRRWLHAHIAAIVCILTAILIFSGSSLWYAVTTNAMINEQNSKTSQTRNEAAMVAKSAKEKKAQKEAEEKAAQEMAAKEAAEAAKHSNGSTAQIDSKACNSATTHNDPTSIDVVVNKKHCIQPLGYVPPLASSHGATLNPLAINAYNQLYAAAIAAGQPFSVTSSYRSHATQVSTYNNWVMKSGSQGADTYSARPGYSEHQTGFAFDVAAGKCTLNCFGSTTQYQWLQQHAADYGFIQRYYGGFDGITGYKAEEWHYRYVGVSVAKDMQAKGIKTLEQYWNIPGGDY